MLICHPIDAPFIRALFEQNKDLIPVYDLWVLCKQEYAKPDSSLRELVAKYTKKLEAIPSC